MSLDVTCWSCSFVSAIIARSSTKAMAVMLTGVWVGGFCGLASALLHGGLLLLVGMMRVCFFPAVGAHCFLSLVSDVESVEFSVDC